MQIHEVRARRSAEDFPRTEHLAWKLAEVAVDPVAVPAETESMVINRIIDNAAVAAAAILRRPVATARAQALAHPRTTGGAKVFGVLGDYSPEWAAWANGVAVRELDFHDTFWPRSTPTRGQHRAVDRGRSAARRRRCRPDPRARHRVRGSDRSGQGNLPARAQD